MDLQSFKKFDKWAERAYEVGAKYLIGFGLAMFVLLCVSLVTWGVGWVWHDLLIPMFTEGNFPDPENHTHVERCDE